MSPRDFFRKSEKTGVIERIFNELWDARAGTLSRTVVSIKDVSRVIREMESAGETTLSPDNIANFLKDILRSPHVNRHWPPSPTKHRFTGRQITGTGDSFEFVPFAAGQLEAFPDEFPVDTNAPKRELQTLTLPPFAQEIDRWDEARLLQTAVALRVIETHFALVSQSDVRQVAHMQSNVKLSKAEIDALFVAQLLDGATLKKAAITCEVKYKDPLIASQIAKQVQAVSALHRIDFDVVIPTAITVLDGDLQLIEFEPSRGRTRPISRGR